jgi:methionyl-tRNA formyltransferase
MAPDYLVTAAFGQILPQEVLDIPRYGTVNVHASLLPRYRGPNPVQQAILNGDAVTGVTLMFTELTVDTGPILLQAETPIDPDEDAIQLTARLAHLGARLLPDALSGYAEGRLPPIPQDATLASHAPKRTREDAWIDWNQSAQQIHDQIRGQQPWPGAMSHIAGNDIKLLKSISPQTAPSYQPNPIQSLAPKQPGTLLMVSKEGMWIQTGTIPLLIDSVQPAAKPPMSAQSWANGGLKSCGPHHFTSLITPMEARS